jgi:HK97 family phage major capsid protein
MSVVLKELREKRGKAWKRANDLNQKTIAEKRDFTVEEKAEWDTLNKEIDSTGEQIERTEKLAKLEARRDDGAPLPGRDDTDGKRSKKSKKERNAEVTAEHRALAFQAWCKRQLEMPLSKQQRAACRATGLNPSCRSLRIPLCSSDDFRTAQTTYGDERSKHIKRAMSATNLATGGAFVPESFVNAVEVNMLAFGSVLQQADVIRTERGGPMPWPTVDDTSNEGSQVGENTTVTEGTNPATGRKMFGDYKFTSKPILVGTELLEDSPFNVPNIVGGIIGERLARILNRKFTTGSGAATVSGFITDAKLGKETASATAITYGELIDLIHSIDPAYRTAGATFQLHDNIVAVLRKLTDSTGAPIWQPGLIAGAPDRLLGYAYGINQHMDSAATATKKVIAFGDFKRYKVRQVRELRLYRLQERYRDSDQDGFVGFIRVDGGLLNAGTNPIAYLQMHS